MQRTELLRTFILMLLIGLLAGCDLVAQRSQLNVSWMPEVSGRSAMTSRAAITETYPGLSVIWLRVSSESFTTEYINREFNDDRFKMNEAGDALIIEDTEVALDVPTSEPLTIELIAFNTDGYRVFRASKELTTSSLSSPVINVDLPLQVDIDENIPVLSAQSECVDLLSDGLCDVYEDLFLNAAGQPDIDGDGIVNSEDTDADGDGILDLVDRNSAVSGDLPTDSNDGYPMFIQANTEPVFPSDTTVTTIENQSFTIELDRKKIDPDVNDVLSISVSFAGSNGTATLSGSTITYVPNQGFVGTDTFVLAVSDLFTSGGIFPSFTVNVLDDPEVNTPPNVSGVSDVQSTPGAGLVIDVLAQVTDPELTSGVGETLRLTAASTDQGDLYLSRTGDRLYFISDINASDGATITFTVADSQSASASGSFIVWLYDVDSDQDGLGATTGTNGAALADTDDTNPISDAGFISDFHSEFATYPSYAASAGEWTNVTTNITSDTVWSLEGSPYVVGDQEILVDGNVELRIEAGVEVKFKGTSSQLAIVNGAQLSVIGGDSDVQSVRFTSINDDYRQMLPDSTGAPASADWKGIRLNSNGRVLMYNADIQFATNGLSIEAGSPLVDGANITQASDSGVLVNTSGRFILQDSLIAANKQGVQVAAIGADSDMTNVVIRDNRGGDVNGNGGGISLGSDLTGKVFLANALVLSNEATSLGSGGAIYVGDNSALQVEGTSIIKNLHNSQTGAPGIYVNAGTNTLSIFDTVFYWNDSCGSFGECSEDVLDFTGTAFDTGSAGNASDMFSSGIAPSVDLSSFGPDFLSGWYFRQDGEVNSLLLDAGSVDLTNNTLDYLDRMAVATTEINGAADTGTVDIGFHHDSAYPTLDQGVTSISQTTFTETTEVQNFELIVSPKDSNRVSVGPYADVTMDSNFVITYRGTGYSGDSFEYIGNGRYRLSFSMSAIVCSTADSSVSSTVYVDGNPVGSITFIYDAGLCQG